MGDNDKQADRFSYVKSLAYHFGNRGVGIKTMTWEKYELQKRNSDGKLTLINIDIV